MTNELLKKAAAKAVLEYIKDDSIIGVGTGSTVNYFIEAIAHLKHKISGVVASSKATAEKIKELDIPLVDLNSVNELPIYIDGADEIDDNLYMIKGGGAALTGEKIVAAVAKQFICIADERKKVKTLGDFPLAIEVIPMARSYVAREMAKLGGSPIYREGIVTDYGNVILDIWNLKMLDPKALEQKINNIAGVVSNGLFTLRSADILLLATTANGTVTYQK